MNLKERAQRLKSDIPAVFIALKDRETPWYAKLLATITVGYALSPIDLIPDFIPVLGYLDDFIVLPALVALTIRLIPEKNGRKADNNRRICGQTENPNGGIMPFLLWLYGC